MKYVAKSGEKPPDKASSDGISMKVLGYKWEPEKDGRSEVQGNPMNFQ